MTLELWGGATVRYSGFSPAEVDTFFDRINAETLHERIWSSLQKFIPADEEATAENVEAACEAFLKKYPDIAEEDVREAVWMFGENTVACQKQVGLAFRWST